MVALLGFAALAVDVGMLYAERTQLRNGADAAAIAVAQKCAKNLNDADCSASSTLARSLASSNAGDGISNVSSLALDKSSPHSHSHRRRPGSRQGTQPGFAILRARTRHQ